MKTSTKIHAAILILVNFLLLHYVLSSIPLRIDMTAGNSFTLSDSAKSLLSKVEEPVRFDFYRTRSVEGLSPQIKMHIQNFGDRVEQMLLQFERAANGKVILDRIDPEPDTPAEENAIAAGVHGQSLPNGDTIFLGLVISQGDSEHVIPFFDWNKEGSIEYDIAKAVHEAQQLSKPKLGLISTLPLKAPPMPMMPGQPPQEDQYIISELESSFNVEVIEPTASELPQDLDMLMVVHPIGLPETLLFDIDQFTLSGKPMFLAVDPSSLFFRSQQQQNQMMMGRPNPNTSSDFQPFFSTWGISYSASEALADPDIAYTQQNTMQPAWLIFREDNVAEDFLPAAELNAVLLLEAGSLGLDESSKLTIEPILQTTESAGSVAGMMLQFAQQGALLNQLEASNEKQTVAGLLSGEFTTAFPNGKPSDPSASPESGETTGGSDQLYTGEGNVFIITDTDWLLDQFSIQRQNFLGMMTIQPINDNLTMGTNVIEFLGGSQDLIGIRSKGEEARSFDRVQAMEVEAQKQYQIKLQEVEEKISEMNQEIQQLVTQQQGTGLIVAGPELTNALQELRENEANMRAERRVIRRELRKDIDALKWKLVSLNIGYSPIGLVIFGFIFYRMRKQKAR
ncbi:GldG family protein [Candidatus Pelagisphaera phototrophica]|uniref:GldG family protein n=1 Tax=Candidatus Pelagisphaera phototrophica TaxID=2684113 RepID=UPI0019F7CC64|nr:GldG family protein [Candidatus Pelagisphaera phototrophica]QXD31803.1 Gldg family protein [Candidatus Pelagisphaera phototrophica]